jgi:Tol biopolymer transport system component
MTLSPGVRLGPYEIIGPLGAGGMGEVYKARDPRLSRDIAIKVLPEAAVADSERRTRFEREARAVAALNHPNIVTIHAVEEAGGVPFFTMEYVEGRTLGQMIPPRGLPLPDLLKIAIPLSDAVGAAHQHGILHRDLKPANVMVTAEGRVKVLDFGLAKLKEAVMQADGGAQTTAESTGEGRIVGTVAYMSPEQAEGKALDQRSDVFSLGILLYEMATGQRPFKGDTNVSVMSAILKDPPGSVTDLRPDLPRDFGRILRRALNKDPEHRYQTAKDLRNDLEALKEDLDSGEVVPATAGLTRGGWLRRPWVVVGGLAAVVAVVMAGTWFVSRAVRPTEQAKPTRAFFDDFTVTRPTTEQASNYTVAISPDGRYVAYAYVEGSREGLRVRQTDAPASVQVVPPAEVRYNGVTFSPDGSRLYFATYPQGSGTATLYEVPVLGGTPRRLIEDVDCRVSFSPDAARFAFVRQSPHEGGSIVVANTDGSGERVIAARSVPNEFVVVDVAWSPDGRSIAAAVAEGWKYALVTVDVANGTVQRVGQGTWDDVYSIVWPQGGSHLIVAGQDYAVGDSVQIWEVALPSGIARRITKDVAWYTAVSVTADARTLVAVVADPRHSLWVASAAQPEDATRIGSVPDTVATLPIRWTGDGRLLFTANVSGSGNYDVWAVRPDGSEFLQLTTDPALDGYPTVSPDGRYIAFLSSRDGKVRVWRMDPDGGRQQAVSDGTVDYYPVVTPDSQSVYFVRLDQPGYPLYAVLIEGGPPTLLSAPASVGPTAPWQGVPAGFTPDALSPDGSFLLGSYYDTEESRRRVAVVPTNGTGQVRRLDIQLPARFEDRSYAWAPDGRAVTFVRKTDGASNLWRQPLDSGPPTRVTSFPPGEDIARHAWSHDGRLLAMVRGTVERRVVMMQEAPARR